MLTGSASPEPEAKTAAGGMEYELFAILIHAGTATGGHYHAYIKADLSGDGHGEVWCDFNDAHVSEVSEAELAAMLNSEAEHTEPESEPAPTPTPNAAAGDEVTTAPARSVAMDISADGSWSKRVSSANAYMVVYRCRTARAPQVDEAAVPSNLQAHGVRSSPLLFPGKRTLEGYVLRPNPDCAVAACRCSRAAER
eukprot:SAG11_NODE_283_length_11241_cov_8.234428_3_plen_196_part_00